MLYQISPYPRFVDAAPHAPNWVTFVSALAPNLQPTVAKAISDIERRLGIVSPESRPLLMAKRTDANRVSGGFLLTWYMPSLWAELLLTCRAINHYAVEDRGAKRIPEPKAIATILWAAPWWRAYMRGTGK